MKRGSTFFLRGALAVMALAVLALCIFLFPHIGKEIVIEYPSLASFQYLVSIISYATAILFFTALYQALKLLNYIDKHIAFSELSVKALKWIKHCAITMSIFYATGLPVIYHIAEKDDAPGLILFGCIFACAPLVVATFAAVLEKLVRNALDIKAENDLTV